MDKTFLLLYKGNCASVVFNGIKFTQSVRTANVGEDQAKLFMDSKGNSIYDEIEIREIKKAEVVADDKELTVEGLKKAKKLEELQEMARERELDDAGSKTELAERIVEFEKSKTQE